MNHAMQTQAHTPSPIKQFRNNECRISAKTRVAAGGLALACALLLSPAPVHALENVSLGTLQPSEGFSVFGEESLDFSSYSISGIGDFNGDGFEDIIIGADYHGAVTITVEGEQQTFKSGRGAAYVIFGNEEGTAPSTDFDLTSLDGQNGFKLIGAQDHTFFPNTSTIANNGSQFGISVSGAGDVNGDGFSDLLVGAFREDSPAEDSGAVYLVFGQAEQLPAAISMEDYQSYNIVRFSNTDPEDQLGGFVSGAGDFNGDGFDDIILGAENGNNGGQIAGRAYLIFGSSSIQDADLAEADFPGITFRGIQSFGDFGFVCSGLGDINGDGLDDIGIAEPRADVTEVATDAGAVHIVYGTKSVLPSTILANQIESTYGSLILGSQDEEGLGLTLQPAGDVNGDGFSDFLINEVFPEIQDKAQYSERYVVYGRAGGFPSRISDSDIDPTYGTSFSGTRSSDQAGQILSSAGDYNNDGYFDILIGEAERINSSGIVQLPAIYLLYGSSTGFGSNVDILADAGELDGLTFLGEVAGRSTGTSLSAAGYFNGDQASDIMIGDFFAPGNSTSQVGETIVVYGNDPTPNMVSYKAFAASGDAPKTGIGLIDDGSSWIPASRFWVDYSEGNSASLETASIVRTGLSAINGSTYVPPFVWLHSTDRQGYTSANVTVSYRESDFPAIFGGSGNAVLVHSDSIEGPWTLAPNQSHTPGNNQVSGQIPAGTTYIAIAPSSIFVEPSGDANDDGVFDAADIALVQSFATGSGTPSQTVLNAADVCPLGGDGQLTSADVNSLVLKLTTGNASCQ